MLAAPLKYEAGVYMPQMVNRCCRMLGLLACRRGRALKRARAAAISPSTSFGRGMRGRFRESSATADQERLACNP